MKLLIALACAFAVISLLAFVSWARTQWEVPGAIPAVGGEVHLLEPELRLGVVRLNEQIRGSFTLVNNTDRTVAL